MKPITFHPDADAEVTEAAQFYEARSPGLGSGLLEEVQRSLAQVVTRPEAHQRIGRRVWRKPLWRFPYNLIYAIYADRIRIVAFAHQKPRPFYWRKRLKDRTGEVGGLTPRVNRMLDSAVGWGDVPVYAALPFTAVCLLRH